MSKPVTTITLSAGITDTSSAKAVRQLEGNVRDHEITLQAVTAGTTVTGSKSSNAALTSLIAALHAAGIITDKTS